MTTWATNEHGTPLCPVPHTRWDWDEKGDERVPVTEPCGEEVMLMASFMVPPEVGGRIELSAASHDAVSAWWEVKCLRGHVLAMSDGEEWPEDFDWEQVFSHG